MSIFMRKTKPKSKTQRSRGVALTEQLLAITAAGVATAAVAPGWVQVQAAADRSAITHLAGVISTAMSLNYAGCLLTDQAAVVGKCVPVHDCAQGTQLLQGGHLPEGFDISPGALVAADRAHGVEGLCSVVRTRDGLRSEFVGISAGELPG